MSRVSGFLAIVFALLCGALPARGAQDAALERGTAITDPAALRELEEETGIKPRLVEKIARSPNIHRYRLPDELVGKVWKNSKWIGQAQTWYLARFLGSDADVNLETKHPEFRDWQWAAPERLPELIVPFKRELYREVLDAFADYL